MQFTLLLLHSSYFIQGEGRQFRENDTREGNEAYFTPHKKTCTRSLPPIEKTAYPTHEQKEESTEENSATIWCATNALESHPKCSDTVHNRTREVLDQISRIKWNKIYTQFPTD